MTKAKTKVIPFPTKRKSARRPVQPPSGYFYKGQAPELQELKAAAQYAGLSEREIAKKAGLSRSGVGGWFNGRTMRPLSPTLGAALLTIPGAIGWDYRNRRIIFRQEPEK